MNITRNIPNLIGGISQQPAQSRLVNQCEDQLNYVSTPASGLTTRPPLMFKSAVPYSGDGAFFVLDRDADTKYNMWISPDGIYVEDLDGTAQYVTYNDDSRSYLALPVGKDARDSYRILPVADTCFIINRSVTTQTDPNSSIVRRNQALIHIKQVAVSTTWSVALNDVQVSFGYSSKADQSISTQEVATKLTRDLLASPEISENFEIVTASSVIYIRRKDGGAFSVGVADTRSNTYSSLTTYKIKNFTDLPTIAPDGYICCISGNNGSTADDYYVRFRGTDKLPSYAWHDTGARLYSALRIYLDATKVNRLTPIKVGTKVSCTNKPWFKTEVVNITYPEDDEGGGPHFFTVITLAERFPDNPGNLTYGVAQQNTGENLARGVWEECAAPDQPVAFAASTMPHVLFHDLKSNTWTFRPVDWNKRVAGDNESAPFASFINKPLTAIFLFRNRLGLIAGDSVSMSAAGDLERFFPTTVQTLADDEPIDISVAVNDYSDILATCAVQDNLLFWSKKRQYSLSTPEVLSPKTAAILPTTGYACLPDAGLPVCGSHIFFVDVSGDHDQLYEYAIDKTSATKEGLCVTNHVPGLIPHQLPVILTASQSTSVVALYSSATPNELWLYQYYISGDSKVQSAWSRHIFGGTIRNMAFRESVLWLEIIKNGTRLMCTLDFAAKPQREADDFIPALDFQIVYNNQIQEITLPYTPVEPVVLIPNSEGELLPTKKFTWLNNTITLLNPASKCVIGQPFQRIYELSRQYPAISRNGDTSVPLTNARFQLKRFKLNYLDTGAFTVTVSNNVVDQVDEYPVQSRSGLNRIKRELMETRQTNIPCRGRNTDTEITISSQSWTPETFLSADIEMNYVGKTRII